MPHVVDYGGNVLASPEFQPIVFVGDPLEPDITAFAGALEQSTYWSAIASEYGVGALRSLPLVVANETAPSALTTA
jgi:hypothetical protein